MGNAHYEIDLAPTKSSSSRCIKIHPNNQILTLKIANLSELKEFTLLNYLRKRKISNATSSTIFN